ncbi:putative ABC transporter ATP-binding protein [uncultured archaeon]|nr:putative ABC transporter ATP-binding protein [uncultured archaeon]
MKTNIIELKNVKKTYKMGKNQVDAVSDINLIIYKGEFVIINGASGSGKSTIMHLIGCLDVPSQGSVLLEDRDILSLTKSQMAKIRGKKIGFIFQQFNLIRTLTALENVALPMEFQNNYIKAEERAKELLELVELKDRMHHKPTELSGGQAQRVAIARALANNPEIILADEPTGNLDSETGEKVIEMLYKLHKEHGKTLIIITHDTNFISKFRNIARIIKLKDGRIIYGKK